MKLKKNTSTTSSLSDIAASAQISEAVAIARTNSRSAFNTIAESWRHTSVTSATWDSERASLTVTSGDVTATLAVPSRYHGECAEAMAHMEPTRVYAFVDEATAPASLKVYLSCSARPDWNICLRPEAAVLQ